MKGLLIKDLLILREQFRAFVIILACGFLMSFTMEYTFVIGYMSIVAAFSVQGTIGYDEFDHGFSFLFTLPPDRKTYVREKYLLSFCLIAIIEFLGCILAIIGQFISKGTMPDIMDMISAIPVMMSAALLLISLSMPVRLKYGTEKSRTVQYLIYGAVMALVFGGSKLLQVMNIDISSIIPSGSISSNVFLPVFLMIFLIIFGVSEKISERIMTVKEF